MRVGIFYFSSCCLHFSTSRFVNLFLLLMFNETRVLRKYNFFFLLVTHSQAKEYTQAYTRNTKKLISIRNIRHHHLHSHSHVCAHYFFFYNSEITNCNQRSFRHAHQPLFIIIRLLFSQ